MLYHAGALRDPMLYLSLYFMQNRYVYYRLLDEVRMTGNWEAWMEFFLEGVRQTAELAVLTARRLTDMFDSDRERIIRIGRAANSALRVQQALKERPVATLPALCERTGLTFPTVSSALNRLMELGIVREATGAARNRIFVYDRFLSVLNEGTEVE